MALTFIVDGKLIAAEADQNLLAAGLQAGLEIPYFCWHPAMGAVGACRQCAVKVFQGPDDARGQIVMACMTKSTEGMRVSVADPDAVKFRAGVVEMVLTNHPHDCPVCEVGGECHLQDMAVLTGHHQRRYNFPKRTHLNQNLGPLIRHEMNRCIGCYRCVRFYRDYAGGDDFGVFGAHRNIYFGRAEDGPLESVFAGNLVEVCPTGVFVDKPFSAAFRRKWDLRATPSICPHCAVGCNITIHERAGQFRRVMNRYNDTLNGFFLCDRGRFGVGFVESPARLRQNRDHTGRMVAPAAARARLASILAEGEVIGIGAARASVEANFALCALVGPVNFYAGLSGFDAAALTTSIEIMRRMRPATLAQVEQADAFLVLGDDPALVAPRLALALRQAARRADDAGVAQRREPGTVNPFMMAASPGWLDSVTRHVHAGAPHDFALGLMRELDGMAPRGATASLLLSAAQPVIVAGGDAALLATAANLVLALRRHGVGARLSLMLPEANSVGLGLLDHRALAAAAQAAVGRHVIVLERDILREPALGAEIFAAAKSVTVLDHIATPSTARADTAIAVASFAESDGVFVNLEGRAQGFFKAILADEPVPPSWQVLRDAAIEAGRLAPGEWETHAALLAAIARDVPALAPCQSVWPDGAALRPATQPHRHSGRTASTAHVDVRETLPPQAEKDSPLGATMEGAATALPWSAGWNSAQLAPRAPASGLAAPDIFLFEDGDARDFEIPATTPHDDRRLGIEELSQLSPAIIAYQDAVAT
jgi:NADH-quinone oxidoreductase subunit G